MRNFFIVLSFLIISSFNSYPSEKTVKVNGVVYEIDINKGIAKVGENLNKKLKRTLKGDVVLASNVIYKRKYYPVTSIGSNAFLECQEINSITIPNSITKLEFLALSGIYNLKQFLIDPNNKYFKCVDGILYNNDMTTLLRFPPGRIDTTFEIPQTVTTVGEEAFANCLHLKTTTIPNGVKYIKHSAFSYSGLDSIRLPYSVIEIGDNTFSFCSKLVSVIYQNKALVFSPNAFAYCDKSKINIEYEVPTVLFLELANEGNTDYQYKLAKCYLTGYIFPKDIKAAKEWFLKASKNGHTSSQKELGDIYYNGVGGDKNIKEAINWYSLAAKGGNISAQHILGDCYCRGIGVKQALPTAVNYYKLAANQGDTESQLFLGCLYLVGCKEIAVDYNEAFKWYKEGANGGNAEAAYFLAICYNEGKGTEKNEYKALQWIEKAVDGGIEKAQGLYCILAYNDAVQSMSSESYSSAIDRFTSLLKYDKSNIDAYLNRGYCYLNLQNKNYLKAEKDFKKVLELDHTNQAAINNLQVVIEHNNQIKEASDLCQQAYQSYTARDYTSTIAYCAKSISIDNTQPYPYYLIGRCYYVCELYADAIKYFNQALTVDPTYTDATKAIKSARTLGILNAISQLATSVSNSLNNAYNNSINYGNSSNYKSTTSTRTTTTMPSITKQKQVCSFCHGTGYNPTKEYPAEFGLGHSYKDTPCEVCGSYENHYHKTCPICGGRKYK